MPTFQKRFPEDLSVLADLFGFERVRGAIPRLEKIYDHTERMWRKYVRQLPGGVVRYLLIAEAAPWSNDGRPQFVLDPASRSRTLMRALRETFLDAHESALGAEEALAEFARRGFVIVDSIPFAMDYSGKRARKNYQRLIDKTAQTYLLRKLASPSLSWSPRVRVALGFKLNGEAVISALDGRLRVGRITRNLDSRSIAVNGAGYPDAHKLRAIYAID